MGYENERGKFLDKVLARNSSVGCSSRVLSYYRSGEGVPFKWEMQPGKAKEPPKEHMLPPLSPPPAILSLGFPKPCIEEPKPSTRSRLVKFWKKITKRGEGNKLQECSNDDVDGDVFDIFTRFDQCSSDSESIGSPQDSSTSSSSSFVKSRPSLQSTSSESPKTEINGWPLSCIHMHIPRTLHVPLLRRD